jgi:hypothetical protein
MIKSRIIAWGHVARMGKINENLKGRHHLEEPDVDERIILKWILGTSVGWYGLDYY